jgi:uncharacterized UPF0160 family protein
MNLNWNESGDIDQIFLNTVELAKNILNREIASVRSVLEAEKFVIEAYEKSSDKRLIVLEKKLPWEKVITQFPEPLYVIFPKEENWRIRAVRANLISFENRKDLPKNWAGLKDQKLAEATGVPDAIFCHNMLFVAAAKSRAGALALAKIALEV